MRWLLFVGAAFRRPRADNIRPYNSYAKQSFSYVGTGLRTVRPSNSGGPSRTPVPTIIYTDKRSFSVAIFLPAGVILESAHWRGNPFFFAVRITAPPLVAKGAVLEGNLWDACN